MAKQKWTEERVAQLMSIVNGENPVSASTVQRAAEELDTSVRSVAAKLRHMGLEVESSSASAEKVFSLEEEQALKEFLQVNNGQYTFAEIAAQFANGKFTPRQIQGKVLHLEMTNYVKPTPPKEAVKTYSEDEENKIREMVKAGAYLEDIAEALGREVNSIRGKCLSLYRQEGLSIPQMKNKKPAAVDPLDAIKDELPELTVDEIAERIGKTARGVKTMLTHRGLSAADYDGAKRAEKLAAKKEVA